MNRHFLKRAIQMAKTHMKRWPTSLVIREIHIKTTCDTTSHPLGYKIFLKTQKTARVGKDTEKLEPLCPVGKNVKWYIHCENSRTVPQIIQLLWYLASPLLGIYPPQLKAGSQRDFFTPSL